MKNKIILTTFFLLIVGNIYGSNLNPPDFLIGTWQNLAESNTNNFVYIIFNKNNIIFEYGIEDSKVENWEQIYSDYKIKETLTDKIYSITLKKDTVVIIYEFELKDFDKSTKILTYSKKQNEITLRKHETSVNLVFFKERN